MEPKVGQKWKDRDPRTTDRVVEIISIGVDSSTQEPIVTYVYKNRKVASRITRFVKAFRPVQ